MMIESEKCTAEKTYKGFRGYNTMLGFFAETGHCGYQAFRTGNTSPADGVLEALKGMRSVCPKGTDVTRFRSDSAGWTVAVIGYCEDTGIDYTITADMNSAVKRALADIPEANWTPLLTKHGQKTDREVAETIYCFNNGHKAHRLIVQRAADQQLDLFSEGRQSYYALSTNSTLSAQEVIHFHNGRGQAENCNKELKYSLNLDYLPTNDFNANKLWFSLGILTYNLIISLKQQVLPKDWLHKKISTLRWQLIHVAGHLVYHARQWVLKIASVSQEIFDVLQLVRFNLCQI
jgi:Transposase DDE domain group 1